MHLIRPDVGTLHWLGCASDSVIDVALVDEYARPACIGTQRIFNVFEARECRRRLPCHLELAGGLDRIFLAFGDDTDEIADLHHSDEAGNVPN